MEESDYPHLLLKYFRIEDENWNDGGGGLFFVRHQKLISIRGETNFYYYLKWEIYLD